MHERESESDTLLGLMAGLETKVSDLSTKAKSITSKVDPVPPPVMLATLPGPTTPVVHEPVPAPSTVVVERATLAENIIVQWLVQQAIPWNYQQQVLETLHRVRLGTRSLVLLLIVALGAGVVTGYVAVPQSVVQSLRGTYQGFACPATPATPITPETATPKQ